MKEIPAKYEARDIEKKWYQYWVDNNYFHSEPDDREPYVNVIPPPNVTGVLHMGHMLNNTIQDVLVRRARMLGKNAVWVPGTDHASIATEAKVVAKLKSEGIDKNTLSREEFLEHAWDWTEKHGGIILEQLKKLGASCDWDRTCFTMDATRSKSVIRVFVDLYEKGLIYRGVRMVNWDTEAKTAVSDEEVIYTEENSKLYYVKYKIQGEDINLLLGSRSFYEGWDSNRPNVINMINIGKQDAKKFVLQGIGRGIRIEPHKGERKRLAGNHADKNVLLETLFVFATDKNAVKAIIETVENEKNTEETPLTDLFSINPNKPFDLLIPIYKDDTTRGKIAKFNIAKESLEIFKKFIASFDTNTLLIKTGIAKTDLEFLLNGITNDSLFQIKNENVFSDMDLLLQRLVSHISVKNKVVSGIKEVSDEIIHFKHIKVVNFSDEEISSFKQKVQKVKDFELIDKKDIEAKIKAGKLSFDEALKLGNATSEESFKDLKIKKIAEHYYLPLIYSDKEKVEYIKHIIEVESEVKFIKNLEKHIKENKPDCNWMFSKIDQNLDSFHIPYFYKKENIYRKFFPDFIFWIKKDENYKIVFVDPKGTSNADYQNKVDEFEKLFLENGQAKIFTYKNFKITFDLKLVAVDVNSVSDKYEKYWLGNNDFNFLK